MAKLTTSMVYSMLTKYCFFLTVPQNDTVNDDDVEQNKVLHEGIWSGHLSPLKQDLTTLTIQWEQARVTDSLCTFGVHYYPRSDIRDLCK